MAAWRVGGGRVNQSSPVNVGSEDRFKLRLAELAFASAAGGCVFSEGRGLARCVCRSGAGYTVG